MENRLPATLTEAIRYFADEQVCIDTVAALRWPEGSPVCPNCSFTEHYYLKTQKRWKCKKCYKQFSVKVGTVFEDSAIPLDKWLIALWMLVNCKNGTSSYEVSRSIGVTQKSAWFVLQRLRLVLRNGSTEKMGGNGPIEVDETHIGPNTRKMHRDRRLKLSKEGYQKVAVMGMLDRESRQIRAKVVPNVKRETLQNEILNEIERGSEVYTDRYTAYDNLAEQEYVHETVNHLEEYVRGQVHTQGIENFWSLLKRTLRGTYVAVEPFHMDRYVDEQVFRYNNRATRENPLNDTDRFLVAVSQAKNKRLTYKELTGKNA